LNYGINIRLKSARHRADGSSTIRAATKSLTGVVTPRSKKLRSKLYERLFSRSPSRSRRYVVRYGLLAANILLLLAVIGFVIHDSGSSQAIQQTSPLTTDSTIAANPLDQVSSADIAVNVARMANMPEAVATANDAESLDGQLSISETNNTIVDKPQLVATALKSRKDIIAYTTVAGDSVTSLAAKFNVTSNTIRWSNGLTGDAIAVGKVINVLPGVNGIIYTVKTGDTPDTLATRYSASKDQIVAYNDAEIGGLTADEQIIIPGASQPVTQTTSSYYSGFSFGTSAIYGSNGYDYGFCTWYVANRRAQLGRPVPSNLGNAYSWYVLAQAAGLPTGLTPQVGAVMVNTGGDHVAVVEAVNDDGSFWISEMNSYGQVSMTNSAGAGGWGRVDYKLISSVGNLKFIY